MDKHFPGQKTFIVLSKWNTHFCFPLSFFEASRSENWKVHSEKKNGDWMKTSLLHLVTHPVFLIYYFFWIFEHLIFFIWLWFLKHWFSLLKNNNISYKTGVIFKLAEVGVDAVAFLGVCNEVDVSSFSFEDFLNRVKSIQKSFIVWLGEHGWQYEFIRIFHGRFAAWQIFNMKHQKECLHGWDHLMDYEKCIRLTLTRALVRDVAFERAIQEEYVNSRWDSVEWDIIVLTTFRVD